MEKKVNFVRELSIIAARDINGKIIFYDLVKNIHKSGILHKTIFPAKNISDSVTNQARDIAAKLLKKLDYIGVLAIEFFELANGELLVNEFAPRPHNSGHFSLDSCLHDQFEQAIRAAVGMSVIEPVQIASGEMVNLIGNEILEVKNLINQPNIKIHDYDKAEIVPGRKMGHYTKID